MIKALTVLTAVLLVLSACASKVELQQDTSGSDEMLPSPCVGRDGSPCAPVPYEAPGFTWGRA